MKKKKFLVTACSIVAFVAIAAGAYYITKAISGTSSASAVDFLVSGHEWQKSGEESVVWTFENDGTCKITTNSTEVFNCTWSLDGENLKIKTKWLRDLEDEFTLHINQAENSFTVTSKADEKSSTFTIKKSA